MILIFETHPVQYHAPVFERLASITPLPFRVIYGSDFSCRGYHDVDFGKAFSWDVNLLQGYPYEILTQAPSVAALKFASFDREFQNRIRDAGEIEGALCLGYSSPFDRHFIRWTILNRKPLLFRAETSDVALTRSRWKQAVRDFCLRRLYGRCAVVLPIGTNSRNHYRRLGVPDSKMIESPYCVDERVFSTSAVEAERQRLATRLQLGIPEAALVLVYSGKLTHKKGVDLIPKGIRELPAALGRQIHLLVIGDGELRSQLESDCARGSRPVSASFVGFRNQRELSAFYNAGDMFILPSRFGETWGLVVNEALLHGLPCIVSEMVGSAPDLITSGLTGEIFTCGRAEHLATQLQKIIGWRNPRTRSECQKRAANFSINRAAEGIGQAFARIRNP